MAADAPPAPLVPQAVLANEFHGLSLACSPSDIVPSGPSYDALSPLYKTCALPGSTPGALAVSGDAYLALTYDFRYDRVWRNLGVLALQALVFLVVGVAATEVLHFAPGGSRRVWNRTRAVQRRLFGEKWRQERGSGDYGERSSVSVGAGGAENGHGAAQERARRPSAEEMRLLDEEEGRDWREEGVEEDEGDEGSIDGTPLYGSEQDEGEPVELEGSVLAVRPLSLSPPSRPSQTRIRA